MCSLNKSDTIHSFYIMFDSTLWLKSFYYPRIPDMNLISGSGKMNRSTSLFVKAPGPPDLVNTLQKEKRRTIRPGGSQPQLRLDLRA